MKLSVTRLDNNQILARHLLCDASTNRVCIIWNAVTALCGEFFSEFLHVLQLRYTVLELCYVVL